jgi:hypothetical protein
MAQLDDVDDGWAQLTQLFSDLGFITTIMRARIASVDRLREPLTSALLSLQELIHQVLPWL